MKNFLNLIHVYPCLTIRRSALISQVQIMKMGLVEKTLKESGKEISHKGVKLISVERMERRELFTGWYCHWLLILSK